MAAVTFSYRSTKKEAALEVRFSYRKPGENISPKTGREMPISLYTRSELVVDQTFWLDYKKGTRFKDSSKLALKNRVDSEIHELSVHIHNSFESHPKSRPDKSWLVQTVKEFYRPVRQKDIPEDLISFIDFYINERDFEISKATKKKLRVIRNKLLRMQEHLDRVILIKEIGEDFKRQMVEYYLGENYSQNTMQRELGIIKTVCRFAKKKGLEIHPELLDLRLKKENAPSIYLSFSELDKISSVSLKHDYLDNARDWLIISCFCGQRVSDFMRFQADMIREEKGKKFIDFTQKKTGKRMTLPITDKIRYILNKRNGDFPRIISDQRYNEYIKEVCRLAGLTDLVRSRKSVNLDPGGNKAKMRTQDGEYHKWELVTSHIGRRSFASNFYGKIPTTYLIYATGHSTEAMFLQYIGKSNKDLALELAGFLEKFNYVEN